MARAFEAPGPTWPGAHFHCPDIMIAAPDIAAINQGNYQLVLGELHLAMMTFNNLVFFQQHPAREDLRKVMSADIPAPQVFPITPFEPSTRLQPAFTLPDGFRLATSSEIADAPPAQTLRSADLLVREQGETLVVQTRDGRHTFEIMQVLSEYFSLVGTEYFQMVSAAAYSPRITIDNVVVHRATWRNHAADLDFLEVTDAAERFVAVRRWALKQQMPRFLFYRTVNEQKPCFLDLTSPLYVELFWKETQKAALATSQEADGEQRPIVTLSEMLPTPEQAWLVDAQGRHFTSEIRIATVDGKRE